MTTATAPADTAATLSALAAYWANPAPARYSNQIPGRIAGGPHDQLVPQGTANPYWEIIRQLPLDTIGLPWRTFRPEPDGFFVDPASPARVLADRSSLCVTYSWSIPSPGDIAWIKSRLGGKGLVEPGAGGGYWAWQLAQAGVDVIAYEPQDPADNKYVAGPGWHPVLRADHDAVKAHPDRAMFLCWPSYGEPWAAWALACYQGDQLFYAGEGEGGCCADDDFFALLDAEWENAGDCPAHVSYGGIHCYLTEYRRKLSAAGVAARQAS